LNSKVTNGIIFINDIIFVLQEGAKVDMQIKITPEEMTRVAERIRQLSDKFDDMAQDIKG